MHTKSRRNGNLWSAAAESAQRMATPLWLCAERVRFLMVLRQAKALPMAAHSKKKENIMWRLREVTT